MPDPSPPIPPASPDGPNPDGPNSDGPSPDPDSQNPAGPEPSGDAASRIARAGAHLRKAAARTLAKEKPPAKARPLSRPFSTPGLADGLPTAERASLVEVPDADGKPLLCMPLEYVVRQQLPFRAVSIALYTRQKHLVIQKRRDARLGQSGAWDLFTSLVLVDEASEDAATRIAAEQAHLGGLHMSEHSRITDKGRLIIFYTADLPPGLYPSHPEQELLTVDEDELYGLVLDVPELISPSLTIAARNHILFR